MKKHGGARPGSGAKKKKDKKISLFIYPLESEVLAVGGKEAAKRIAEQAITRVILKIK